MTGRQKKALAALIRAPTRAEAAEIAGVGVSTLRGWFQNDPEFRAEYEKVLSDLMAEATAEAQKSMGAAVHILREIAEDTAAGPTARISACKTLLETALKLDERFAIEKRLDALETMTGQGDGG